MSNSVKNMSKQFCNMSKFLQNMSEYVKILSKQYCNMSKLIFKKNKRICSDLARQGRRVYMRRHGDVRRRKRHSLITAHCTLHITVMEHLRFMRPCIGDVRTILCSRKSLCINFFNTKKTNFTLKKICTFK